MRKLLWIFYFLALVISSCENYITSDETLLTNDPLNAVRATYALPGGVNYVCGESQYTLWAGQTTNAGTLTVQNDNSNLYVTYTTTGVFGTLHLWAGTDLSLLPKNSQGTPVPGQFPYVYDATGMTTYTYTIPLKNIAVNATCGNNIYIVAHAEVTINNKNETAFGGNLPGTGTNRWYFYAVYSSICCNEPQPPSTSEKLGTAFAKGSYVFTTDKKSNPENLPSLKLTNNRWGWAINLITDGTTSYDLWVGAGLNYTSKGLKVGSVEVVKSGTTVNIVYKLNPGYSIEEGHIYAGDTKPATIAPGQYGNTFYFDPFVNTYTFTTDVTDQAGDGIWLIIHAIVWGPGVTNI